MTLTQIHALLAVLEYGGFTEASKTAIHDAIRRQPGHLRA